MPDSVLAMSAQTDSASGQSAGQNGSGVEKEIYSHTLRKAQFDLGDHSLGEWGGKASTRSRELLLYGIRDIVPLYVSAAFSHNKRRF